MKNSRDINYVCRELEPVIQKVSMQFPVLMLTGPRQVGKTCLLEHLRQENRTVITLDDMNLRAIAKNDPALLLQRFPPPLLVDEVQYAPELFSAIKMEVDRKPVPGSFWLTGSQSFPLMKGVSESLAGRVAILNLLGFSARESDKRSLPHLPFLPCGDALSIRGKSFAPTVLAPIYERIWLGSFPSLVTRRVKDRDIFYRSFIQTYLLRDVRDLMKVGDLDVFMRFLKAAAARTGQLLNFSDMARDCGVSVNTIRNWISVLQASHLIYLLPAWHNNLSKRLYSTSKLHFLDTGLCAYLTEWSSPATLSAGAMAGAILETYVFCEILKSWWHAGHEPHFYHYRDKDGREIDLLISCDGQLFPLEIKRAATVTAKDVSAFALLEKLGAKIGRGAVLSFCPDHFPVSRTADNIPIGWI